jgi:hypothetical protein
MAQAIKEAIMEVPISMKIIAIIATMGIIITIMEITTHIMEGMTMDL